jgi:hypothetical protein
MVDVWIVTQKRGLTTKILLAEGVIDKWRSRKPQSTQAPPTAIRWTYSPALSPQNHLLFVDRRINEFRPRQFKHLRVIWNSGFWARVETTSIDRAYHEAHSLMLLLSQNANPVFTVSEKLSAPKI